MFKLSKSLSIAASLVAAMWCVGLLGYFAGMSMDFIVLAFLAGIVAAVYEWQAS